MLDLKNGMVYSVIPETSIHQKLHYVLNDYDLRRKVIVEKYNEKLDYESPDFDFNILIGLL